MQHDPFSDSTHANRGHELDNNPITKFFPIEELPASANQIEDISAKALDDAVKTLLSQTLRYSPPDAAEGAEFTPLAMPRYEAFRKVEHLSQTAKELYTAAGLVVGASLETMTDAIYRIERAMVLWQSKQPGAGGQ